MAGFACPMVEREEAMAKSNLFPVAVVAICAAIPAIAAGERGTEADAKTLLNKAITHITKAGTDTALKDFSDKAGPFVDHDLYVLCEDFNGKILAHGGNPALVGRETKGSELTDQFIHIASSPSGEGAADYDWADPTTKKVAKKTTIIKKAGNIFCGVGFFR